MWACHCQLGERLFGLGHSVLEFAIQNSPVILSYAELFYPSTQPTGVFSPQNGIWSMAKIYLVLLPSCENLISTTQICILPFEVQVVKDK